MELVSRPMNQAGLGTMTRSALLVCLSLAVGNGCKDLSKVSAEAARGHVAIAVEAAAVDVEDVRGGLPEGAKYLVGLWKADAPQPAPVASGVPPAAPSSSATVNPAPGSAPAPSSSASPPSSPSGTAEAPTGGAPDPTPAAVREALERARNKVQALRVAKGTFFAVTNTQGIVLRNDQEQDLMVGHGMFEPFPKLKEALRGRYVETRGSMPEAATIKGRPDGQWVAAAPVTTERGVVGLYTTGWGWSAYARRLELAVRGAVQDELQPGQHEPLVYVAIVVEKQAYGWDIPEVSLEHLEQIDIVGKATAGEPFSESFELTGRKWGLAALPAPVLGSQVAVVVMRSET